MKLDLPYPWMEDEQIQGNLDRIKTEWREPASAWQDYTATVSSASVTLGTGGTNVARYAKVGRTVNAYGVITLGTGGSFTGASDIEIALPLTAASSAAQIGTAYAVDTGVYRHLGIVVAAADATTFKVRLTPNGTDNSLVAMTATAPFTWGDTDTLYWQITYESAV